jgi:glutathione synthase/RimK-type ligase-like ATP-grasp enzyme
MQGALGRRLRTIAGVTGTIALATCAQLPAGDEDSQRLAGALNAFGVTASWHVWDDPQVDWERFDLTVVRSTWDYTIDRDAFIAWAAGVTRLANPGDVLAWNTDKTYLRDLSQAELPVVPTSWSDPGEPVELPGREFVVKPSIGAGSNGAGRFDQGARAAARAHAAALHEAGRTVMVQPYLDGVDTAGETALIYVDGAFSHAVSKAPMLTRSTVNELSPGLSTGLFQPERITPSVPEPAELAVGEQVLAYVRKRFGADLLYTRVDVLPSPDGPVVIELELAEPSLFLEHDEDAATRFAAAVSRRL